MNKRLNLHQFQIHHNQRQIPKPRKFKLREEDIKAYSEAMGLMLRKDELENAIKLRKFDGLLFSDGRR